MDFVKIREKILKNGIEIYPDFIVCKSRDLMVRGKSFYAIYDKDAGMWTTDEFEVQRLVDQELWAYKDEHYKNVQSSVSVKTMSSYSSGSWNQYRKFINQMADTNHELDGKLIFSNTKVKKTDYASKRLNYPLEEGSIDAYDKIISTLYSKEERDKIEWAIGSVISGDAKNIQKFIVFFGEAGTGKSTILNIIQKLFDGYYTTFEAKALTSGNNAFSTEVFRTNPLVAIQHDGDLSKIEDNTKLNSIVSHEEMVMNEKYKASYTARVNCFLFMATNRPVKITDAKSGIIRRLIDVRPTGKKIPPEEFYNLYEQIDFELGAIASHCLQVYRKLGKNYYADYRPTDMIMRTDVFFNFVESYYDKFRKDDGVTLKAAYELYKQYCDATLVDFKLPQYKFREELKNYFSEFQERARVDGEQVRSYYHGFLWQKFNPFSASESKEESRPCSLVMDCTESLFDIQFADCPAQYPYEDGGRLERKWKNCKTKLSDIDTKKVHHVKVPENLIVIDFDIKDANGDKSFDANVKAASKWPPTYAELSKSGKGVHLHYIYNGDVSKLSRVYDEDIEVKVFTGDASLRRKLTKCNNVPIAEISSGLPLKEEKTVINIESVKSEKKLRELILRNMQKEIHPGTKPSMDFIYKIVEDAYDSGLHYDISDMKTSILAFANNSTHHAEYCVSLCMKMHYHSNDISDPVPEEEADYSDDRLVFYDVEVFPNLFLVNWKYEGEDNKCVRMINPTPIEIERLLKFKLVGFNCRRYDNHMLYARLIGYTNEQLFILSQKIITDHSSNAMFGEAYNLSYTDVYDFCSKKQSLKKWEIELGIHHQELGLPWDKPVPEDLWIKVAEYCDNDVIATEAVFKARHADFVARQILADIAGMTVNDTTNSLSTRIIFGKNKTPQNSFNYRDLSQPVHEGPQLFRAWNGQYSAKPFFPGYSFVAGKSTYRGEETGEGGYVYAEPGIHYNVALLDIASMHPTSIEAEELFGPEYTKRFSELKAARVAIKHKDFESARGMLNGVLSKHLDDESSAKDLAQALKIVINSVYGLTSAKFTNPFKDPRNKDNIVAKRGALFMIDLKHEVQSRGYTVAHIKTDSIKIPNATKEIIDFVMDFGKAYGYSFEHEATYEKMCLVNDAVYIAKEREGDEAGMWTATGAQFQHPYVFKYLFSKEPIEFNDMCEAKSVTSALYLDMNENIEQLTVQEEKELAKLTKLNNNDDPRLLELIEKENKSHNYIFVGRAGLFCPVKPGCGGGLLMREKDGKYYSATGAKGFRWKESEIVKQLGNEDQIDKRYFKGLVDDAVAAISEYGDFEQFVSDDPVPPVIDIQSDELPF